MSFLCQRIQYSGHILSATGIKPLPLKTKAIRVIQPPKNAKQVLAFLVLVGYYQKYIKKIAGIATPLTTLMYHDA